MIHRRLSLPDRTTRNLEILEEIGVTPSELARSQITDKMLLDLRRSGYSDHELRHVVLGTYKPGLDYLNEVQSRA